MASVVELLRRCAWCGRVLTLEGWKSDDLKSGDYETSTICPECVAKLQAAGMSARADEAETA